MITKNDQVLLYYHFIPIDHPEEYAKEHKEFMNSLNLKGRVLLAKEGINGTLYSKKKRLKSIWTP